MSWIAGLRRRIRALAGPPDPRLDRAARRVEQLEGALAEQRALLEAERSARQAERDTWTSAQRRLKRSSAFHARRVLEPAVVRELLPHRAKTIGARAVSAHAERFDTRMQEASPAYRAALADLDRPYEGLAETEVQGLRWTMPVPHAPGSDRWERFLAKQRFPYRSITQTREFSVGPVLIDIGANVGRMSIPRVILGDFERAYCAEPDPLNFTALVRNVALNGLRGLVLPDQVAIGSETRPVRLRQAKYSTGHSVASDASGDADTIEVPCWTLDAWCERLSIDPALVTYVKVDTQGWEVHVLRGASALLRHTHIAWQLEVAPAWLDAAGTSKEELYALCAARFSHFVDLNKDAEGSRAYRTSELPQALDYLVGSDAHTDIVLFHGSDGLDRIAPEAPRVVSL